MKARKGCWTCTARRVRCDGALPICQKCARAQRECHGYGARLSWPKDSDKKRAITGPSPPTTLRRSRSREADLFLNTTWRDMQLYYMSLPMQFLRPVELSSKLRIRSWPDASYSDLIRHFHDTAYLSLATFSAASHQVRDIVLRMALAGDTAPGLALLSALLAFSLLHRSGLRRQAVQLKISALHFLAISVQSELLNSTEAAQHVAASMLLGAFETLLPSQGSDEWPWYIWGARDVIQATGLQDQLQDADISDLLDWVYYHNALSNFSLHHWRRKLSTPALAATKRPSPDVELRYPPSIGYRPALPSPNPSHAILNLLSDVCDRLLDPWDFVQRNEDYYSSLRTLEKRAEVVFSAPRLADSDADSILGSQIWQLATRVYLTRASRSPWEPQSTSLDSEIDAAFGKVVTFCSCKHFFPLFIIAYEARTDERRTAIMRLIDRTERSADTRSFNGLQGVIQSIWKQQDLHADNDLLVDYVDIISTVISSSTALPSFV